MAGEHLKCGNCGHTWHTRKDGKPKKCPGCYTPRKYADIREVEEAEDQ